MTAKLQSNQLQRHPCINSSAIEIFAIENVSLLDPSIADRYPHIELRKLHDIGNVFRHEFGNIEAAAIWNTITGDRPPSLIAVGVSEFTRLE